VSTTASSDEDGTVLREVALAVLKASDVSVSKDGQHVTLARGGVVEAHMLPDRVARNMLHRFSRRFGIEIHLFYAAANAKSEAAKTVS
jgi:hypothetical protein